MGAGKPIATAGKAKDAAADARGGGGRAIPLVLALDTNKDGAIAADEIAGAARSLATLDRNGDGQLTMDEIAPAFGRGGGGRRPNIAGRNHDDTFSPRLCRLAARGVRTVAAARAGDQIYTFHYEQVLGTSFELKVVAPSAAIAARAEAAAMEEIARNARILSSYDPDSEFSRWFQTRGVPTRVSPELFDVLSLFDRWRVQSSGALEPAAEAATRLWKAAAGQHRIPADAELTAVVRQVRQTHWTLNPADRTATHLTDVPLALNSFTKSFIVERAAGAAMSAGGARAVVVNIGGDLVVRGDWTEPVQIANPISDAENGTPLATLAIANRAVATSGGYRRGVDIDGHHYSHIVDPRTAQPAGHILSATVTAPDAVTAGALATAFCVLSPQESRAIAAAIPGVEFTLVERDGGSGHQRGVAHARGSRRTARAPGRDAGGVRGGTGRLDPAFELAVNIELARFDGFGAAGRTSRSGSKTRIGSRCARWRSGSRSRAGSRI